LGASRSACRNTVSFLKLAASRLATSRASPRGNLLIDRPLLFVKALKTNQTGSFKCTVVQSIITCLTNQHFDVSACMPICDVGLVFLTYTGDYHSSIDLVPSSAAGGDSQVAGAASRPEINLMNAVLLQYVSLSGKSRSKHNSITTRRYSSFSSVRGFFVVEHS